MSAPDPTGPAIPATFAGLCDAIAEASRAYRVAADRMEAAAAARRSGLAVPCEDELFDAETAAADRRAGLVAALMAWPAPSPADMAHKLRLAADELRGRGDDADLALARVALAEAAAMLAGPALLKGIAP